MGYLLNDEKHIEIQENNNEHKIKPKSYDKIRDIVLGKKENIIIDGLKAHSKADKNNNTIKNNNNIKNKIDIGL